MKTLIITAVTLLLLQTSNTENFTIKENKLEWSKVHTTDLSIPELTKQIKIKYKPEEIDATTFTTTIEDYQLEFTPLGYKKATTPIVAQGKVTYDLLIQLKQGKYKTTITNIKSITPPDNTPIDIERFTIKKDKYKPLFTKHLAKILEYNFNKTTIITTTDSDW